MGLLDSLERWIFLPEIWVIAAIVFIGIDIVFGLDFFILSIGVAAMIVAGLLFAQDGAWLGHVNLFETWDDVGIWFAGLSIGSIALIRLVLQRRHSNRPDINEY